jgi:hypothetical protein
MLSAPSAPSCFHDASRSASISLSGCTAQTAWFQPHVIRVALGTDVRLTK